MKVTMCPVCGELLDQEEIGCAHCAVLVATPHSRHVLVASHSRAYQLGRSITAAAGGALAGAIALAVTLGVFGLLPHLLNGAVLPIVQAAVMLAGIFTAVIGFSAIIVSFAEMGRSASLEISNDLLRFDDLYGGREIDLADVRGVRVARGMFGRAFGYGTIEIFTNLSPDPAAVIPGVRHPHSFRERFESILKQRERELH